MRAAASLKTERVEARVTPEQKELFQRAADLEGRSLSDFLIQTLQEAAEEAIQRHHVMKLTARETRAFVEAFLNPREPNDALRKAARRHRELLSER